MSRARLIEVSAGAILVVFGLAFAIGAFQHRIGDFIEMGPGMFPLIVGIAIVLMGVAVVLVGLVGPCENDEPFDAEIFRRNMRVLMLVSAGLMLFGLLVRGFGLFPAIIGLVFLIGLTERERRPITSIVTAILLAILAWLIFSIGLGLNIPAFRWGL